MCSFGHFLILILHTYRTQQARRRCGWQPEVHAGQGNREEEAQQQTQQAEGRRGRARARRFRSRLVLRRRMRGTSVPAR
eukprot:9482486-Pyramimonas_sp.AAC.1